MKSGVTRNTKQIQYDHKKTHVLLDARRSALLRKIAEGMTIQASQLATVWLSEKIDQVTAVAGIASELGDIAAAQTTVGSDPGQPVDEKRARSGRQRARPNLHEEIAAVLRASSKPLTVAEIADAIRQRAVYAPPRSKRPIGTAAVSSRISHPHYRSLFTREGSAVALADPTS